MPKLPTPQKPLPITDPMACEVCGKAIPLAQTYSIAVNYNMPGPGKTAYQCPNLQHFGCTHEHAVFAAIACLFEHIEQGNCTAKGLPYGGTWFQALKTAIQSYVVTQGAGGV